MTADGEATPGASFYALGPEFEWLASAWDGFARDLAETSGTLRHIAEAVAADPRLVAESSGLSALESATDRLVRELVDDAARIRRTLATYEHADATVHASVPGVHGVHSVQNVQLPGSAGGGVASAPLATSVPAEAPAHAAGSGFRPPTVPHQQGLWHPDPGSAAHVAETALGKQQVPYSQEHWYEGYRTDCSGYVSMCWGLRDSLVTSTMPQVSHPIAKEDLRAGDILVNRDVATGHVILFDRWADYAHSTYVGFELCPQGTLHHVLPYPYYDGYGVYEPYRYNQAAD